jgi:hypothetical protein
MMVCTPSSAMRGGVAISVTATPAAAPSMNGGQRAALAGGRPLKPLHIEAKRSETGCSTARHVAFEVIDIVIERKPEGEVEQAEDRGNCGTKQRRGI